VAGEKAGFLLAIGFSLEMLSLGLATCATCRKYRWSVIKSLLPVLGAALAFGLAALLYLVTQELLVEALLIPSPAFDSLREHQNEAAKRKLLTPQSASGLMRLPVHVAPPPVVKVDAPGCFTSNLTCAVS
jgi:hypothetical protein